MNNVTVMNNLHKIKTELLDGVNDGATILLNYGEKYAKEIVKPYIFKRILYNSIKAIAGKEAKQANSKQIFYLIASAPYAPDIEFGIKPKFVSVDTNPMIEDWVNVKGGIGVKRFFNKYGGIYVANEGSILAEPGLMFMTKTFFKLKERMPIIIGNSIKQKIKKMNKR